ncbi:MAG: SGNH/GDSL hydrolase family protein, partial [Christensenellales bacterium]
SIYRYQELYSVAISKLARSEELPFVDVRSAFLECIGSPFSQLISGDGLHPTEKGYEIVARCFRERLESIK